MDIDRQFRLHLLWLLLLSPILQMCSFVPPATAIATDVGQATIPSAPSPTILPTSNEFSTERRQMVEQQIQARGVNDPAVLAAMRRVPRHAFVPDEWVSRAYDDTPLPIGYGQTISQPFIVGWMTELLSLSPGSRVLEVGTGSGYQAAILEEMGMEVYSIEIIEALASAATDRLTVLGYERTIVRHADGYFGWEEHAPFEAIIVTCAPDHIPPPLIQQLGDGGRMVLPVGPPGGYQSLWLVEKHDGNVRSTNMGGVRFVPLTGQH
jgi:protein-L-isoaspartate(D-aspartate) O-methyltransferase